MSVDGDGTGPDQEGFIEEVGPPQALQHDAHREECSGGQRDDHDWAKGWTGDEWEQHSAPPPGQFLAIPNRQIW